MWVARLDGAGDDLDAAAYTLSRDERERAARYRGAELERRFVRSRAALRRVLARYRGEDAKAIVFEYGTHGKPRVARDEPPFSVSHSGGVAVVAVSGAGAVGVDTEEVRPIGDLDDLDDLAARNFAAREFDVVAAAPPSARTTVFLRVWTAKEAYVKAVGEGLSIPLAAFCVDGERPAPVLVRAPTLQGAGAWWTYPFVPCEGYVGAVAAAIPDATLMMMGRIE